MDHPCFFQCKINLLHLNYDKFCHKELDLHLGYKDEEH